MNTSIPNDSLAACEILVSCPDCGGTNLSLWRKSHDRNHRVSPQKFIYSRCRECDLIFLSTRPPESDAHKFYPVDYGPYQPASAPGGQAESAALKPRPPGPFVKRTAQRLFHRLNDATRRFSPDTVPEEINEFYRPERAGMKLLDFGCGTDTFLNQARNRGWETLGMDVSPQTIEQVGRSGHEAVLISPNSWEKVADESIDAVRMNHVLEHLYHPAETLTALRARMRTGARLHIALPNPRSFSSGLFRSRWWGLECPRHVIFFTPATLRKSLEAAGFSDIQVRQETITKDFVRSLGYLLHDRGLIEHKEVTGMMERQVLAEFLFTPARIAALCGVADRFHVFARK